MGILMHNCVVEGNPGLIRKVKSGNTAPILIRNPAFCLIRLIRRKLPDGHRKAVGVIRTGLQAPSDSDPMATFDYPNVSLQSGWFSNLANPESL